MKKRFCTSIFYNLQSLLCGSLLSLTLVGLDIGLFSSLAAAEIEILTPRPSATITARISETHLVLRRPAGAGTEQLRVEAAGRRLEPLGVRQHQGNQYFHFRLPLKPGANAFTILPSGRRFELKYQPLRANVTTSTLGKDAYLFHRDDKLPESCAACHDLQKTRTIEPLGLTAQESCVTCHRNVLKTRNQHSATANNLCLICHQQSVNPWRIGYPVAHIEDTCLTCHNGKKIWRSRKYVHGPLNVGGCTLCHNPHGDENRHQLWADGAAELCVACHSEKEELMRKDRGMHTVHGIIHGLGCVACHDPHATNHEYMLHKPINELCVSCHQALAGITRGHPVGGHPVAGPSERRRKGRELTCASCHDPHGSPHADLLIETYLGGHFCRKCHK
jgi:predicted CXXCH cytochrome family protein